MGKGQLKKLEGCTSRSIKFDQMQISVEHGLVMLVCLDTRLFLELVILAVGSVWLETDLLGSSS